MKQYKLLNILSFLLLLAITVNGSAQTNKLALIIANSSYGYGPLPHVARQCPGAQSRFGE